MAAADVLTIEDAERRTWTELVDLLDSGGMGDIPKRGRRGGGPSATETFGTDPRTRWA